MTAGSSIDYDALTQDALRGVVRAVLNQVAGNKAGLPGDHHFYIAFNTQAPGVVMSRRLKEKYPEEMMIVLQHRFWDLAVSEEGFEVKLSFDGIPERLCIPFDALKVFFDPSVRFTLQFGEGAAGDDAQEGTPGRRRRAGDDLARPGEKRARPRNRPRSGEAGEESPVTENAGPAPAQPPVPQHAPPTVFTPRAVDSGRPPAPAQPAQPEPVPAAPPEPADAAKTSGGAKIVNLDFFRNKK